MNTNNDYKCVTLKGELADWGKHVLMPFGITLCGMPTVDVNKEQFPQLKTEALSNMINEYTIENEWDITCKKCLEVFEIIDKGEMARKYKNNLDKK